MDEMTYGYGTISFSVELLQQMVTKGWQIEKIECIEGLPEGAEFQRVYADANTDIVFVFRVPGIDDYCLYVPDKYLPKIKAAWRQSYSNDTAIEFPDGKRIIIHHRGETHSTFSTNVEGVVANSNGLLPMEPLEYEVEVLT